MNIEDMPKIEIPSLIIRKHFDMILWRGYLEVETKDGEQHFGLISDQSPLLIRNEIEVDIDDDETTSVEDRIAAVSSIAKRMDQRMSDILDTFKQMMTVDRLDIYQVLKTVESVRWVDSFCWTSPFAHDGNRCAPLKGYDKDSTQAFLKVMDIEYKRRRNELHI
jgi:hypothetical protein